MVCTVVDFTIRPEKIGAFRKASLANAGASRLEPGVVSFEVLQDEGNPVHFLFLETYRQPEDIDRHHETEHYFRWKAEVQAYFSAPRTVVRYKVEE